jgi:hypothetical protein
VPTNDEIHALLVNFWLAKSDAVRKLADAGLSNTGAQARNARHMESLSTFVRQMFIDAGLNESEVKTGGVIPGYFRRSKNWDVVATYRGNLVAVVELKSQVGSEGNNGNNRIEEALGNVHDATTAQELNKAFGRLPIWTAFCVAFGSSPDDAKPSRPPRSLFPLDPIFEGMTYARQWEIAVDRFVQTGAYSAGWMVTTWVAADGEVKFVEPVATATAATLEAQIQARVAFAKLALD